MRRREFIMLLGGATTAWPHAVLGQQRTMPVIGYLSSKGEIAEAGITAAMRRGLNEVGFIEGKNVSFLYGWSDGDYQRLPNLATEFVRKEVDVIAASGSHGRSPLRRRKA